MADDVMALERCLRRVINQNISVNQQAIYKIYSNDYFKNKHYQWFQHILRSAPATHCDSSNMHPKHKHTKHMDWKLFLDEYSSIKCITRINCTVISCCKHCAFKSFSVRAINKLFKALTNADKAIDRFFKMSIDNLRSNKRALLKWCMVLEKNFELLASLLAVPEINKILIRIKPNSILSAFTTLVKLTTLYLTICNAEKEILWKLKNKNKYRTFASLNYVNISNNNQRKLLHHPVTATVLLAHYIMIAYVHEIDNRYDSIDIYHEYVAHMSQFVSVYNAFHNIFSCNVCPLECSIGCVLDIIASKFSILMFMFRVDKKNIFVFIADHNLYEMNKQWKMNIKWRKYTKICGYIYCTKINNGKWYKCSKCKTLNYCSRKCQKLDWKAKHRDGCKRIVELLEECNDC
eukprot:546726_1